MHATFSSPSGASASASGEPLCQLQAVRALQEGRKVGIGAQVQPGGLGGLGRRPALLSEQVEPGQEVLQAARVLSAPHAHATRTGLHPPTALGCGGGDGPFGWRERTSVAPRRAHAVAML